METKLGGVRKISIRVSGGKGVREPAPAQGAIDKEAADSQDDAQGHQHQEPAQFFPVRGTHVMMSIAYVLY